MSHARAAYAGAADLILFDAKTPKGVLPGGMGVGVRLVAAGRISRCLAVGAGRRAKSDECCRGDCAHRSAAGRYSSGVESAPGVKDTDKITNSTKPSNT